MGDTRCQVAANATSSRSENDNCTMSSTGSRRRSHPSTPSPDVASSAAAAAISHTGSHKYQKIPIGYEETKPLINATTTESTNAAPCINACTNTYATFQHARPFKKETIMAELYHWFFLGLENLCLSWPFHTSRQSNDNNNHNNSSSFSTRKYASWLDRRILCSWPVITAFLAGVAITTFCMRERLFLGDLQAEWKWDHNVYTPQQQQQQSSVLETKAQQQANKPSKAPSHHGRNLLVAQVTGSNAILKSLGEICSRPNRAYARQWGRDYVRYTKPAKKLTRSCFDKVDLLHTILERQQQQQTDANGQVSSSSHNSSSFWLPPLTPSLPRVVYDVVALFPADAIITDLDADLLSLIPPDKLVAVPGWDLNSTDSITKDDSNFSDVLLVNLKHKYARIVVNLWQSLVEPPVTCGAGNDLHLLLHAVESVLSEGESLASVVASLTENRKGMIADNAIRVIPVKVPGHKAVMLLASHSEAQATLHTTADSVCYRYYPKCEVF